MGDIRRHQDTVPRAQHRKLTCDPNLDLPIHDLNERIKRGCVLAQLFPCIKGEQGDVPGLSLHDLPTDD